ncbi:MAG: glycerophosphoryl diester phosphodiesterase membrane domain-containing protein [Bacteroides sp.]|nr:glycerophosphoryl diester phosphodiesterase membrane domain-containing protein [Bacteroides sp.]
METYNYQSQFTIGGVIDEAWALTKKHFPVFLLLTILSSIIAGIFQYAYYGPYFELALSDPNATTITEDEWMNMMVANGEIWNWVGKLSLAGIFVFLVNNYLMVVGGRMLHAAVYNERVDMTAEFKNARHTFLYYLGVNIVFSLIVTIGCLFCILPGIFLAVRLMFAPMIAINHPELTFSEAFTRSWQMTKGHFWKLIGLYLLVILLNILGIICCCVGYLLTIVITYMMYGYAYKLLYPVEPEPVVEAVPTAEAEM